MTHLGRFVAERRFPGAAPPTPSWRHVKQEEGIAVPVEVIDAPLEHRVGFDPAPAVHREEHDPLVARIGVCIGVRWDERRGGWCCA